MHPLEHLRNNRERPARLSSYATIKDEPVISYEMNGRSSEVHISPVFKPSIPKCRRPIRLETYGVNNYLKNNCYKSQIMNKMSKQQELNNLSKNEASSDESTDYDMQTKDDSNASDEETDFTDLSNYSKTVSPEKRNISLNKNLQYKKHLYASHTEKNSNSFSKQRIFIIVIGLIVLVLGIMINSNQKQLQSMNNSNSLLLKSIESIKNRFCNQESDIWNDITSGINEVVSRTPKIPSIILLFANESSTMDCLASAIAHASSTVLGTNSPLHLSPEDFGNDPGEIIDILNKRIPENKAVIIRDVLNINAEAIKALHNLCDRVNPLVGEAIYIITMNVKNYESSQKKLAFVERQIYHKLSRSVDKDILTALIARITDGAIISVRPEPNIRYC